MARIHQIHVDEAALAVTSQEPRSVKNKHCLSTAAAAAISGEARPSCFPIADLRNPHNNV